MEGQVCLAKASEACASEELHCVRMFRVARREWVGGACPKSNDKLYLDLIVVMESQAEMTPRWTSYSVGSTYPRIRD